jgi:hypothetical protein
MQSERASIQQEKFEHVKVVGSGRTIEGLDLTRCTFTGSVLAQYDDPEFGLVVRDVVARRTTARRVQLAGVRFEDVLVEGLNSDLTRIDGCVFRHVTLRGRAGSLMLLGPNPTLPEPAKRALADGIARFYAGVDWALDITEAEFDNADLYYLPGDLVRRDEETQFLLRRDRVAGVDVKELPIFAEIAVRRFEDTPFDSLVAVAPKRHEKFAEMLTAYRVLRERGLAE